MLDGRADGVLGVDETDTERVPSDGCIDHRPCVPGLGEGEAGHDRR
jgi:hypothetical protein